jgi:hypothetical protein
MVKPEILCPPPLKEPVNCVEELPIGGNPKPLLHEDVVEASMSAV